MIVRIRPCRILYGSKLSMRNKTVVSLEFLFCCTSAVTVVSAKIKTTKRNGRSRLTNVDAFCRCLNTSSPPAPPPLFFLNRVRLIQIQIYSCRSAMFWNFCVGIHMYSASTYDTMKPYRTRHSAHLG